MLDCAAWRHRYAKACVSLDWGAGPRGNRLANGSDMASAFVTIAQAATTAPLNPSYREDEFAFYLEDLGAKAIVLKNDYNGPARQAAEKLGLIVLNLIPTSRAGEFTLAGPDANAAQDVTPTEDDVA